MTQPKAKSLKGIPPLIICIAIALTLCLCPILSSNAMGYTTNVSVNGIHLTLNGVNQTTTLIGMDDTTVLANAMLYYCEGQTSALGDNMNFPSPTTGNYVAHLDVTNISQTWYSFFWFVAHYNLSWVRLQNGDSWSSQIMYQAWKNHQTQYYEVLDSMLKQAYLRGIYVSITLAGSQWDAYNYGGTGSVFTHSHVSNSAYDNYFKYVNATIKHCDASPYNSAIFSYDTWNEPDCDHIKVSLWNSDKSAFHAWVCAVANDTTPLTTHIVEMGVASHGSFFGFNQADFNLATGQVGFDICHYHTYFSAEYAQGITSPNSWANAVNKPLNIGEIAKNTNSAPWTYSVWPWFQATAIADNLSAFAWMYLTGTSGYPYTGSYPIWQNPPSSPTISITVDSNYHTNPLTAHFTSSVINGVGPFNYTWYFDDNSTSYIASPSHVFNVNGNYSVWCNVSGGGLDQSNIIYVVIYSSTPPTPPPTPDPLPDPLPTPGPAPNPDDGNKTNDTLILVHTHYYGSTSIQSKYIVAFGILMVASMIPLVAFMERQLKQAKRKR